jgi:hypothetical protein
LILDVIVKLCKEHNVSISKVEKDCGIGNGTIRGWNKSFPRTDNLKKVADYFGVTIEELLTEDRR